MLFPGGDMGLLEGKTALIFGLANERSIAWGITQAMHREGAKIGISYAGEALERRVKPLAEQVGCKWVEECDVTKDEHIEPYYNTSREGFKNAMDISVFSFVALARAFRPILTPGASLMCMTYYG